MSQPAIQSRRPVRIISHPKAEELQNTVVMRDRLEWMVQNTDNDELRDKLIEALQTANHQVMYMKNGL